MLPSHHGGRRSLSALMCVGQPACGVCRWVDVWHVLVSGSSRYMVPAKTHSPCTITVDACHHFWEFRQCPVEVLWLVGKHLVAWVYDEHKC